MDKMIEECNASGLKKCQWCQMNNISEKVFRYWQRCVRSAMLAKETPKGDTIPIIVEFLPPVKQDKYLISSVSQAASAVLYVNGVMIELTESVSADFIQKLLGVFSYVQ